MYQIDDCFRRLKRPSNVSAKPIESNGLVFTVLPCKLKNRICKIKLDKLKIFLAYFKEHGAHKRHFSINRGATENVTRSQRQRNMLYHVSEKFEILYIAHEI